MNSPFARASVASARSAPGHEQAEAREGERAEEHRHDEHDGRRAGPGSPAEDQGRDGDEQDDLRHLHGEDRRHLGGEEVGARQGRAAEPLEDAVVPLVCGRDAEVDQARRDDRQGERARQQEVDRRALARRQDADRGEEEQDDDGDDDRDQHVLAAPSGQPQLHPGLGAVAASAEAGRLTSPRPDGAPTSSR